VLAKCIVDGIQQQKWKKNARRADERVIHINEWPFGLCGYIEQEIASIMSTYAKC